MKGLPAPLRQVDRTFVRERGRRLSYFGGCDYYRLSSHPQVLAAVGSALEAHGMGVGAARLTTGNHPLYEELEAWLARFFRADRALLAGAGFAANLVVAQALAGEVTHALLDEEAHASLQEAVGLLGCPVRRFRHGDPEDLEQGLRALPRAARPLVLTDGLCGRDGSVAPLADYLARLPARGRLLLDDAHGAGVLGAGGRGTAELAGVQDRRLIRTCTLSKAFGSFGGVILAGTHLITRILDRSRWLAASTPIPLPAAAAALAAGRLIARDAAMRRRLQAHAAQAWTALTRAGLKLPATGSPIVAVWPQSPSTARKVGARLRQRGVHPPLIRYPGSGEYFRFALSSEHTHEQLDGMTETLADAASELAGAPRG
jgi:7-keto-8-aminopelargonate synthetase-like enzyme